MEENKVVIPALTKDDIEVRVNNTGGYTGNYYAVLLLYKDARVDMRILDQVFGVFGWQRKQTIVNGNLYCTVSLWDDSKQCWVNKQDVGTENKMQAEKSQASDAFKRACFNVGIGRELYTAPSIFVMLNKDDIACDANGNMKKDNKGNPKLISKLKFNVKHIEYNEENGARTISELIITDHNDVERFRYGIKGSNQNAPKSSQNKAQPVVSDTNTQVTPAQSKELIKAVSQLIKKMPEYTDKMEEVSNETNRFTKMTQEYYKEILTGVQTLLNGEKK